MLGSYNLLPLLSDLAELATMCGKYGVAACLEFMPWSAVTTARAAVDIVKQADGPARGVLVDALHVARSGTSPAGIAAICSDWLHYVQICDGSVPAPSDGALPRFVYCARIDWRRG
jgi:sugar phosphate isomerase/epimerase